MKHICATCGKEIEIMNGHYFRVRDDMQVEHISCKEPTFRIGYVEEKKVEIKPYIGH